MSNATYLLMRNGLIIDFITDDREEAERKRDYNNRNYIGHWTVVPKRKAEADKLLRDFDKIVTDPERSRAFGALARR